METGSVDDDGRHTDLSWLCLACGATIENGLTFVASLRCVDCRDQTAPLDPALVEQWHAAGALF
jgi:hypothetical protein